MVTIGEDFQPLDGVMFTSNNVKLKIDETLIPYDGVLFLTESSLIWTCSDKNSSISIPWNRIGVQAVSADPDKSIYIMMDFVLTWPGIYEGNVRVQNNRNGHAEDEAEEENDEGNESDVSENEITEMWLKHESPALIDQIFNAIRECQSLNPDPAVSEDEDYMEAEEEELGEEGDVEEMQNLQIHDEDKYADAEE